jgi:hypothetical protein
MRPIEEAFLDADFNWVMALQSIWSDSPIHVAGLHERAADGIMRDFRRLAKPSWTPALGKVIVGPPGSGKTHLISELRRRTWESGGWFVFIDIVGINDFWQTVVLGFIESLRQPMNGQPQYERVFKAALRTIDPATAKAVALESDDLRESATGTVDLFVRLLKSVYPDGQLHADVVRALLLQRDAETMDIAYAWLQGLDVSEADRAKLGLAASPPSAVMVARGISWLMSLSGPTMIAIDQIDSIVAAGNIAGNGAGTSEIETKARAIIELFAGGLMDLSNQARRAMTVLSCFPETWDLITERTMESVRHRFSSPPVNLTSEATTAALCGAMIARRLAQAYEDCGEAPPSDIWPFNDAFCREMTGRFPREILMRCDAYRQSCYDVESISEWPGDGAGRIELRASLDEEFEAFKRAATLPAREALYADEGNLLGELVKAALVTFARHLALPQDVDAELIEDKTSKPVLHARLKFSDLSSGHEKHYCLRALGHAHYRAFQARLAAAMTLSGIDDKLPFRHLCILRADPLPGGRVTEELKAKFSAAGGVFYALSDEDLRAMIALRDMAAAKTPGLEAWLRRRQPLCETALFGAIGLSPPPVAPVAQPTTPEPVVAEPAPEPEPPALAPAPEPAPAPAPAANIPLGPRVQGGSLGPEAALPIPLLTRHIGIFAGSGSGKTVLLRRIVEEAAIAGVPAIVLDTNNDLARLGTPWPSSPEQFDAQDRVKADRYAHEVEVVVFTPGVASGRPLTLPALPDFSLAAAGEERAQAVDMAWATLAPLVGASGQAKTLKEGLLKEALTAFASEGRSGIGAFIDFLADLPAEVSRQTKAQKYGVEMSDQLRAKIAVNPLLDGSGQPLDPELLFTASRKGATRISVINFAGLEAEASRQDFVNQLQMALFTFIKRKPSATPRLYVCDEAQNFAPSHASTACKASALALVRQGRKFGLGMIFATQAPKGIDTNIVSNCLTHFYGRMSSPALIDATEEMMAARGRAAKDLGALSAGLFYFSTEGTPQPVKIKTPLCLSHHPQNPATPEDIASIARGVAV